jgi:hypothetical protein
MIHAKGYTQLFGIETKEHLDQIQLTFAYQCVLILTYLIYVSERKLSKTTTSK